MLLRLLHGLVLLRLLHGLVLLQLLHGLVLLLPLANPSPCHLECGYASKAAASAFEYVAGGVSRALRAPKLRLHRQTARLVV